MLKGRSTILVSALASTVIGISAIYVSTMISGRSLVPKKVIAERTPTPTPSPYPTPTVNKVNLPL